jgi:hypothetical protein
MFKRVQAFVEPAHQHALGRFFQVRDVDLDIVRLANTVQTANTLLQQVRVEWQVKHHQMAGELEVTPFRADFRAQQNLCAAILFTEPGGSAVALDNGYRRLVRLYSPVIAVLHVISQVALIPPEGFGV